MRAFFTKPSVCMCTAVEAITRAMLNSFARTRFIASSIVAARSRTSSTEGCVSLRNINRADRGQATITHASEKRLKLIVRLITQVRTISSYTGSATGFQALVTICRQIGHYGTVASIRWETAHAHSALPCYALTKPTSAVALTAVNKPATLRLGVV